MPSERDNASEYDADPARSEIIRDRTICWGGGAVAVVMAFTPYVTLAPAVLGTVMLVTTVVWTKRDTLNAFPKMGQPFFWVSVWAWRAMGVLWILCSIAGMSGMLSP